MIQEGRRKFLRFLGASAVAAPVAAKEAAIAMGLTNGVGGSMIGAPIGSLAPMSGAGAMRNGFDPFYAASEVARLKKQIDGLLTDDARDKARREARGSSLVLDPDIAAMRSLSPAAARRLQVERNIGRRIDSERSWIETQIANLLGSGP